MVMFNWNTEVLATVSRGRPICILHFDVFLGYQASYLHLACKYFM
jgi:hypothetical protein